ncbi:RNA 3'-terminal phosphate cyclase [Sporormia fimetaria CBS 119925]|uniref:RNA 3'-terminal phosphate cyclase n=1 Tax=Sporormia fimetaria CBS 119925 TaxID=1340428 RepID=A0A6A6VMV5_9PLEO|nr:RNA 3'-terminal phosphate cyclase [Sporormia fimetaria CBS 119925]
MAEATTCTATFQDDSTLLTVAHNWRRNHFFLKSESQPWVKNAYPSHLRTRNLPSFEVTKSRLPAHKHAPFLSSTNINSDFLPDPAIPHSNCKMRKQPLHIDGTTLEGGGQLLRLAVGLSALTRTPLYITNIRGKRSGGCGLKAQHLTGVEWLGRRAGARMSGVELKSREILLEYRSNKDGSDEVEEIGTALEVMELENGRDQDEKEGKEKDLGEEQEEEEDDTVAFQTVARAGTRGPEAGAGQRSGAKAKLAKSTTKLQIDQGARSKKAETARGEDKNSAQESPANVIEIKQETPGSVNLVLQAVLPYILFSTLSTSNSDATLNELQQPRTLRITGGTNVSNSPSYDYVEQVLAPMLAHIGIKFNSRLIKRGWSSGALGEVEYEITPLSSPLQAFQLVDRGAVTSIRATIIAPAESENRIRDALEDMLHRYHAHIFPSEAKEQPEEPHIDITFEDSEQKKRYYLLLVATTSTGMRLGRDWLYDGGFKNATAEEAVPKRLVRKVVVDLVKELRSGGCVDEYLRDQIVVFQVLAEGRSEVFGGMGGEGNGEGKKNGKLREGSLHMLTAQWVVERMLGVGFEEGGGCTGVAYVPGMGRSGRL